MTASDIPEVIDNTAARRFEVTVEGHVSIAEYVLRPDGVIEFPHTVVPPELRGRGIATRLVAAALAQARARGLKVIPSCSMFAGYMQRHPETQDLLAPEGRRFVGL